nr:hypothetical protein [Tanacetum cinerariifolium]
SQGLPRRIFNILNRTSTTKEIWDSLELLMKGLGKTFERRKEDMFDEYERFPANGSESIQDYFIRFHKLVNDDLPKHQLNTKFVNNLPAYWSKYVTHTKNVMNMSADNYVDIFTHLRTYEPHALKSLKKLKQSSSSDVDPLTYLAKSSIPPQPSPKPTTQAAQTHEEALMGHVARQCKEPKRARNSQWYADKALLLNAKEKGEVLDAEAEAFLADVECTAPYEGQ